MTEAQFSGIPVISSDRGGLPETVGPGGILIGHDRPAAEWAAVLHQLWHDGDRYRELSQAALSHSARDAIDPDRQLQILIDMLERLLA